MVETSQGRFGQRAGDVKTDPELWAALQDGAKLRAILEDFYTQVYEDARLAPFFGQVTRDHAVGKQYAFLRDKFSGTRDYFGNRPRNAHHWMVIDDDLFDYREDLLMDCARRHGLSEEMIGRWRRFDERFRKQIVKSAPIARKMRGKTLPLEGYESLVLSVGALCDGCHNAVEVGERARYHVRTGQMYCGECQPEVPA